MIALVRREVYRSMILLWVGVRVWRARRMSERAKYLRDLATWERQEAQRMLDGLPVSLFRRAADRHR